MGMTLPPCARPWTVAASRRVWSAPPASCRQL